MNEVLCERHDGWAEVIFNWPDRRNAIDGPLAEGMLSTLLALNADDSIRALVLRGAGFPPQGPSRITRTRSAGTPS